MIHESAEVDSSSTISESCSIWQFAHVRENVQIGENCVIGRGVYLGPGIKVGDNCKIQNYSLIYEPANISDGVFIGPATTFTNDLHPRAVNPDFSIKSSTDWVQVGVTVKSGASVGAGSICVAPVIIGSWALVAAGSVVIRDVPDFALVAGNPAKQIGWVGRSGVPLIRIDKNKFECPVLGHIYIEEDGFLREEPSA